MAWTDKSEAHLRDLVKKGEGLSATEMAACIRKETGEVFTRNAVIGKLHRLGLVIGGGPAHNYGAPPRQRSVSAIGFKLPAARGRFNGNLPATKRKPPSLHLVADAPKPTGTGKTILELGFADCRFIVSAEVGFDSRYCGAPKRLDEDGDPCGPYCQHHFNLLRHPQPNGKRGVRDLARSLRRYI